MASSPPVKASDLLISMDEKSLAIDVSLTLESPLRAFHNVFKRIPGWENSSQDQISITRISGAMTNLVFFAHNQAVVPDDAAKVIIRIFGSGSLLFSRQQERGIFLAASTLGIGPQCLLEFENGRVEQFLPGHPATAPSIRESAVASSIAQSLADFHVLMLDMLPHIQTLSSSLQGSSPRTDTTGKEDSLWMRLRAWAAVANEVAPELADELGVGSTSILSEIEMIKDVLRLKFGPPWLVFCHNDLQYGNILLSSSCSTPSTDTKEARLIDYEYSTVGDSAFDLANHFCEYAANYQEDEEDSAAADDDKGVLDWTRLPSREEKQHFCRSYVEYLLQTHRESNLAQLLLAETHRQGLSIEDKETAIITKVSELVELKSSSMMLLSDLKWGLWAVIQSKVARINFDYKKYAQQRLQQYHGTKQMLLQRA